MSRHLRNHALTASYNYGRSLEHKALAALDRWLATRRSPELLRRVVTMLARHEDKIPPVSLSVLTEDIRMRRALAIGPLTQNDKPVGHEPISDAELLSALWLAPWEHARHTRILNSLTEAGLRIAELEPREAVQLLDTMDAEGDADTRRARMCVNRGISLLHPNSTKAALQRWWLLLGENAVGGFYHVETLEHRVQDGFNTCALRAAQLKAAILLYQATHSGELPENLDALVKSQCVAAVPADPFDGQSFRYRPTDGKDVDWGKPTDGEDARRKPAPIAAVLWSVGPDGVDNGGQIQGDWPNAQTHSGKAWESRRLDVIFTVPQWPEK
jgi:hypothetical protein